MARDNDKHEDQRSIYVALLDVGDDAWCRVVAVHEGDDTYRIISENRNAGEHWEYGTGDLVRCRSTTLSTGERVLVATQRINPPSKDAADEA